MTMSLDAAAQVMRDAMREKVRRHSLWYLVQGGVMILAGILALVYPVVSSFAAVFVLGCLLIISGIAQGISLIDAREVPHFWLQLVSVVLSVIVGVLLIRHRGAGLLAITLLLLVYFMVEGISKVIFALTIRPFPNWGWVLVSGIVGILVALYLWASFPVTAIWLLGVLLGIQLICDGAALGYLAWLRAPTGGQCRSGGGARTLSESIPEHRSERICGTVAGFARPRQAVKPRCPGRRAEGAGLDGAGADRAIMNVTTMRVVVGHCPSDQVPDFTADDCGALGSGEANKNSLLGPITRAPAPGHPQNMRRGPFAPIAWRTEPPCNVKPRSRATLPRSHAGAAALQIQTIWNRSCARVPAAELCLAARMCPDN
jgi:uncharacterized membrane protein HdeD (DUF308 family)